MRQNKLCATCGKTRVIFLWSVDYVEKITWRTSPGKFFPRLSLYSFETALDWCRKWVRYTQEASHGACQSKCKQYVAWAFYFVENILISPFIYHHSQLYLSTGLKYVLFSVHSSSDVKTVIFKFTEGHRMNEKTGKEGITMLYDLIWWRSTNLHDFNNVRESIVHADNCAGQNRNRYFLM